MMLIYIYLQIKGVYPYDYMNTWDKSNDTELPSKEHCYSNLYDETISDDDYDRANLYGIDLI